MARLKLQSFLSDFNASVYNIFIDLLRGLRPVAGCPHQDIPIILRNFHIRTMSLFQHQPMQFRKIAAGNVHHKMMFQMEVHPIGARSKRINGPALVVRTFRSGFSENSTTPCSAMFRTRKTS